MNPPKYAQIDVGIYADNRVALMMRTHGAVGMGIYIYCLVEIGRQSNYPNMQICVDDIFIEAGAFTNGVEPETFKKVIDDLFRIGLLLKDDDGYAYSNGFNKRTGKDLLANYMRSVTQAGKPKQKTSTNEVDSEPETPAPKPEPKPKQPSYASEIIEHWNAKAQSLRCKKLTSDIEKAVAKRCKEYTLAEIKQGIENYHAIVNDPDCFFSYQWNLAEFLSRANGFPVFSGERDEIVGKYRKDTAPKPEPPQRVKTPEEIALGEERRKMIMERAGFGK